MKTNSLVTLPIVALGCVLLSGCGSKQAKDQAKSEESDQRSAQEANQALSNVDHQMASGLYGQKPPPPAAQPTTKPQDSTTSSQSSSTTPQP